MQGELRPDLTVILDLEPATGLNRASQRGALDRIEQEQIDFFHRVILIIYFELSKIHNITSVFSQYHEVSHLTLLPVLQILLKRNFIRLCGIL